jgi:four helix bundle protein
VSEQGVTSKALPLPAAPKLRSYRELLVWQQAVQLTLAVYRSTRAFPREELYGLTSQMRRAAVSIPSNIAEGYGRNSRRDYRQFLGIARGSNLELQTQLIIAQALEFGVTQNLAAATSLSEEVGRMLSAIIRRLEQPPTEPVTP